MGEEREMPGNKKESYAMLLKNMNDLEVSVKQERDFFANILDVIHAILIVCDSNGRIIYFNNAAERITGCAREDVVGKCFTDLLLPEEEQEAKTVYQNIRDGQYPIGRRFGYLTKTGERKTIASSNTALHDKTGALVNLITTGIDITERKAMENELARDLIAYRQLADVIENLPDATFVVDNEKRIVAWNRAMEEITGISKKEALQTGDHLSKIEGVQPGSFLTDMGLDHDRSWEADILGKRGYKLDSKDAPLLPEMPADKYLSVMVSNLYDNEGNIAGTIKSFHDVTKQKRAEAVLMAEKEIMKQAKEDAEAANRAKSLFLATVSHEIRTPMNAVLGLTDIVLSSHTLTEENRTNLGMVKYSAQLLLNILNDVLDFAQIEDGKFNLKEEVFDLRRIMASSIEPFVHVAGNKGIGLTCNIDASVPEWVTGDSRRLGQLVTNLVDNAIKFTEKGNVTLSVALHERTFTPTEDQQTQHLPDSLQLFFSVKDTGIGIAAAYHKQIFDVFKQVDSSSTRKYSGTGIGLTISRMIVENMKGQIWCESEPGRGSTFSFAIPLKVSPSPPEAPDKKEDRPTSQDSAPAAKSLDILLAEDNIINQKLAKAILENRGHRVFVANDGIEAVSALSNRHFDLVLMDIQMPELDGYEITQLIRKAEGGKFDPNIPIIAMTAYAMKGDREKCLQAGMNDYICKPVDVDELQRLLDRFISSDRGARKEREAYAAQKDEATNFQPVDLSRLRKIYKTDEEIQEILELYIETARPLFATIHDALLRQDAKEIFFATHKLKGASGNIGSIGMAQLCLQMEESSEGADWVTSRSLYENIVSAFEGIERFTDRRL